MAVAVDGLSRTPPARLACARACTHLRVRTRVPQWELKHSRTNGSVGDANDNLTTHTLLVPDTGPVPSPSITLLASVLISVEPSVLWEQMGGKNEKSASDSEADDDEDGGLF